MASHPAELSSSRFWRFSLDVYADQAVAAACIDLQDRHGLDVNMLLFALYAGSRGRALSAADIEQLDSAVDAWRRNVVQPLRAVRRWLKDQASATDDRAATLRKSVLERELESEAYQQELMERRLAIGDGSPDLRTAHENLMRYAEFASLAVDDEVLAGFETLVARLGAQIDS